MKPFNLCAYLILSSVALACSNHSNSSHLDNALDVSGSYEVSREKGSQVDMTIEVTNQENRNNVSVTANRTSPFTDKERSFLREQKLNPQKVFNHFSGKALQMGSGSKDENISTDSGSSSQFFACTEDFKLEGAQIRYCISGILIKETNSVDGKLVLQVIRGSKAGEVSLRFNSQVKKEFQAQYKGLWEGKVYRDSSDFDPSQLKSIEVKEDENGKNYIAIPNPKEFQYRGDTYAFVAEESQRSIQAFGDESFPSLYIVYRGLGKNRITIQAQIWSLGDMRGSIEYFGRRSNDSLGYFQFKKK